MVCFSIGNGKTRPITIPCYACDLVVIIKTNYFFDRFVCFSYRLFFLFFLGFAYSFSPVIKSRVLISRCLRRLVLSEFVECLLNRPIRFFEVEVCLQGVSFVDIFPFIFPQHFILIKCFHCQIRLKYLEHSWEYLIKPIF